MATQMPPTSPQPGDPPVAVPREPAALDDDPSNVRILAAEIVGTAVLMIGGPGSAILAADSIGIFGVAFAFGLSLLVMAYVLGHVSGCHINPAVTAGMALARKIPVVTVPFYIVGQLVGAAVGGFIIWVIASGLDSFDATNNFAQNGWGQFSPGGYGFGPMVVVEIFFTGLLVFVVLSTTHGKFLPAVGGITVGLTLTLIHLVTIPVDNTSVNPARSFGSAIFAGADAWKQLWAFIVFPLIGSVLGVLVWLFVHDTRLEDTALSNRRVEAARDRAAGYVDRAAGSVEDRMR
jgi:aquaporin Z